VEGQASGENRKVEARFLSEPKSGGKVFKWTEKWGQASGEDWKVGAAFKTDKGKNAFVALNHCNLLLPRSNFSCFYPPNACLICAKIYNSNIYIYVLNCSHIVLGFNLSSASINIVNSAYFLCCFEFTVVTFCLLQMTKLQTKSQDQLNSICLFNSSSKLTVTSSDGEEIQS
jgi:hypothetical protein